MLQKWKSILINWVNCYFNDGRNAQNLNMESLLNIISHLRENLNLDESKSSKISAHNVEDFITEKYPDFKFENGNVEATNEEQVCLAASLLLYFVCVNSKDIDIKSAMCSKLSDADQEIILKFSKSLMDCSPILCRDVQAAIADACGHDVGTMPTTSCVKVVETPPALRSLHSDVRRLQAALDAERFDRNYLQDELNRTNLRVEKLLKEKEEYKMDIVDLKTKISMCCGQEDEARGTESSSDKSAKLTRQLQEMEERLVQTQGELDDAVYQRDMYKAKAEELKQDRDKWLTMSQQETMRASQLSDELDIERRTSHSLRELVNELRQHNRLNRIDSSFLECDDPDTSIQSLPHNSSMCSEVCANVVEVQLGEERAKIVVLQQQIEALQAHINECTRKFEDEKLTLGTIITERETEVFNLKHRINEEIEAKNNLRVHFSDEMSKLNNEINELEQKLKDNNDHSRSIIKQKMQEIQTLQEEKLTLLQSLSDEITKLENIIKGLKTNIETERQSKMNIKESYDSHIMKLNEKLLNRNNELVELQNNVCEKSEIIESLHLDLRKEKEMREDISNKYHNDLLQLTEQKNAMEHCLQERMRENTELANMLSEQKTNMLEAIKLLETELQSEKNNLQKIISDFESERLVLNNMVTVTESVMEDQKMSLNNIIAEHVKINESLQEKNKILKDSLENEKNNALLTIQEKDLAIEKVLKELAEIQTEKIETEKQFDIVKGNMDKEINLLKDEIRLKSAELSQIEYKNKTMEELVQKHKDDIILLQEASDRMKLEIAMREAEMQKKIDDLATILNDQNKINKQLKAELKEKDELNENVQKKVEEIKDKVLILEKKKHVMEQACIEWKDKFEDIQEKFYSNAAHKKVIIDTLEKEKINLTKEIADQKTVITNLEQQIKHEQEKNQISWQDNENEKLILVNKLSLLQDWQAKAEKDIEDKQKQIICLQEDTVTLKAQAEKYEHDLKSQDTQISEIRKEKDDIISTITKELLEEKTLKEKWQKECETKIAELCDKQAVEAALRKENEELVNAVGEKETTIKLLVNEIQSEKKVQQKIITDFESERLELKNMVTVTESVMEDQKISLDSIIAEHVKNNESLQAENKILKDSLENEKNNTELKLQEEQIKAKKQFDIFKENMDKEIDLLRDEITFKSSELSKLQDVNKIMEETVQKHKDDIVLLREASDTLKLEQAEREAEMQKKIDDMAKILNTQNEMNKQLEAELKERNKLNGEIQQEVEVIKENVLILEKEKHVLELACIEWKDKFEEIQENYVSNAAQKKEIIDTLEKEKIELTKEIYDQRIVIENLEQEIKHERDENQTLQHELENEKLTLINKLSLLQDWQTNAQKDIEEKQNEIICLREEIVTLRAKVENYEGDLKAKDKLISEIVKEKDAAISIISKELLEEKRLKEKCQKECENKITELYDKHAVEAALRNENEELVRAVREKETTIKLLDTEIHNEKMNQQKLVSDFESERLELKNMIMVTKSVMEDQKINFNSIIADNVKINESLQEENRIVKDSLENEKSNAELKLQDKDRTIEKLLKELGEIQKEKTETEKQLDIVKENMDKDIKLLRDEISLKSSELYRLENDNKIMEELVQKHKNDIVLLEEASDTIKTELAIREADMQKKIDDFATMVNNQNEINKQLEAELIEKKQLNEDVQKEVEEIKIKIVNLEKEKHILELANIEWKDKCDEIQEQCNLNVAHEKEIIDTLEKEKINTFKEFEDQSIVIANLEQLIKLEREENENLQRENASEKLILANELSLLQDRQMKAEKDIEEKEKEIICLQEEIVKLRANVEYYEHNLNAKDTQISEIVKEKDAIISTIRKELLEEKCRKEKCQKECEIKIAELYDKHAVEEALRKENEQLIKAVEEKETTIKSLETEIKTQENNFQKTISDFESERLELKNMVTVTETVMEDQKISLDNIIAEHVKVNENLQEEKKILKDSLENEKKESELKLQDKDVAIEKVLKELTEIQKEKIETEKQLDFVKENSDKEIKLLRDEISLKSSALCKLENDSKIMDELVEKHKDDIASLQEACDKLILEHATREAEIQKKFDDMVTILIEQKEINKQLAAELKEKNKLNEDVHQELKEIKEKLLILEKEKHVLELSCIEWKNKFEEAQEKCVLNAAQEKDIKDTMEIEKIKTTKQIEDQRIVITNLEQLIKHELEENQMLRDDNANEKLSLVNKFSLLQDWQTTAEKDIEEKKNVIICLQNEIVTLRAKVENYEQDLKTKDALISEIGKEKDAIISTISKELLEEKTLKEKWQKECENKIAALYNKHAVEEALRKENEELVKAVGEKETFAVQNAENSNLCPAQAERDRHQQVDNSSDLTQSSMESLQTITDLEKIIHDKNRTITTLKSDITYLKTLMAESETKLMDVTNDLEVSKENCQQLSNQLKKIVYQKNEEIAELKKQVNKMSVTENRATQIIKVSAKYQAIILKRIAEIKSNTVLKELTNFGNSNNSDNELRRSLNVGTVTMEDLENFLETTDKHLRRCSEKQITLQKERDRLIEINRINESEIINLKKFLTELSVSFQTFNSVRDLYSQKLSRVVSIQRTVRREILNMDGHVTDACMCKLERGYAAVMQDLTECSMNLERWVERCVSRAISPEKIKQAFMGDYERASLASTSFQNAGLEVQLEELDSSFQKLLEEVARAVKGDGAKEAAALTVQEVRAEYEDKLNRMKAKMKQLYQEQIGVFKEKQKEEVAKLERELQKASEKLSESSRAYEEHIRALTTELWSVGEKFLMKKNEAEWLRRKQRSGSLMSLQHVHSYGLVPPQEEPSRPSDSHSLRSLPVNNNTKREGRGLHMSDEEGEVFDNRFLQELSTPRKEPAPAPAPAPAPPGLRLSELRWRNSLCPPHLKSSYPAETQFAPALDEDDIKFAGLAPGRPQRKEVGITAYKKPGPPTPSKQAGRLSATDSELRESLRVEADPLPSRKTSTPSRIRALFRSAKNETNEGTPRTRRLSNIFRKK